MRDVLRWMVRQPRAWAALAGWAGATALAARDSSPAWTRTVGTVTFWLAVIAIRSKWDADHPDWLRQREEREEAKQQAAVDAILWRYERQRAEREREDRR